MSATEIEEYTSSFALNFLGQEVFPYPFTFTPANSTTQGVYENARVVKSGQALLFNFYGYSTKSSAQFIQIYDSAWPLPSGAIPVIVMSVQAGSTTNFQTFTGSFPPRGRRFNTGVVFANSSTALTYTAGSADCFFDVQYL